MTESELAEKLATMLQNPLDCCEKFADLERELAALSQPVKEESNG